jgi:hypothetical protein
MASISRSDAYRAVADVCARLGVAHTVVTGRKHAKVKFHVAGKPIMVVVSVSPSDRRVYLNSRSATIRAIRQAGVTIPEGV